MCIFKEHTKFKRGFLNMWQIAFVQGSQIWITPWASVISRGQNNMGPKDNCPQNLVRAHKCQVQGPKWPLKMLAYFKTWCIEDNRKKQIRHWKKFEGPQFFDTRGPGGPWNCWLISAPADKSSSSRSALDRG